MKWLFAAPFSGVRTSIFISNYYRSLARAAEANGMIVELFDTDELIASKNIPAFMRKLYKPFAKTIDRFQLLSFTESGMRDRILNEIKESRPDVVFIYAVNAQTMDSVARQARQLGCKVVMWLGLNPDVVTSGTKRLLKELDCLFIYDPAYVQSYRRIGCRRIELIPLGVDVEYIDSVPTLNDKRHPVDVSFIGMIDKYRYDLLASLSDVDLGIWSWNFSPREYPLITSKYRGEAAGDETIRILKTSRISINAHRTFEISGGNYRLFEIPACNTLQLVDDKPAISQYFKIGYEIIVFKDADDLKSKTLYFLKNHKERANIIENARKRIIEEHTILQRFKMMKDIIQTL